MFPCSYTGVVTLTLSWTLLEIPLDLSGIASLRDLHYKVDTQLISLCIGNKEASGLSVSPCFQEISDAVDVAVTQRCTEIVPGLTGDDEAAVSAATAAASAQNASLWQFRLRVGQALGLASSAWGRSELDRQPGWVGGRPNDPLDHCSHLWAGLSRGAGRPGPGPEAVLVVGQYLAIDRDYLLRDLLGCVPRIRYCVDTREEEEKAREMLSYEAARRPFAAAVGVETSASVGHCSPPSENISSVGNPNPPVVLVRNLNRWGDPEHPEEPDPVSTVLGPLFDKWRPAVFVHLSEVRLPACLQSF